VHAGLGQDHVPDRRQFNLNYSTTVLGSVVVP